MCVGTGGGEGCSLGGTRARFPGMKFLLLHYSRPRPLPLWWKVINARPSDVYKYGTRKFSEGIVPKIFLSPMTRSCDG